jgi:hypothetical protein
MVSFYGSQSLMKGRKTWAGSFAVSGGAITAGSVKFKKFATVTRNSAGLYTFAMFLDVAQILPYKPAFLGAVMPTFITPPGGATEGGWSWNLNADNVSSAGTWQLRINQQSWAVADPVQTVRIEWVTYDEVPA